MDKESSSSNHELEEELLLLRQEVAEFRSEHKMHLDTEEGLHALERQLASIIHSAMDGIITVDDEHNIVLFNAAAEEIFQCSASDVLGQPLDQFIPESMRAAHREHLQRFAESGETYRRMGRYREISGLRYTGELFPLEASISKVERVGRRWMTVILRDISQRVGDMTKQRALEDQLRKTERLAELGTLASGMAHEIGTPMNIILGRAELLMRKATDESTRRGLGTIVTQVERITKIMNQLLSFARKRPSEQRGVDLVGALGSVLDLLLEKFKNHNIHVVKDYAPDLPLVLADPDHISQVLLNLMLNACQAMPGGGTLTLRLCAKAKMVELSLQDTGVGIPQEQVSKIFDPFFTTKPVGEGTGLGLTVVHGIIQEHNGAIRVDSVPGQGTTFIVSLPVHLA
ncbi:MAG: PAS domain S-box protein [Nitrospirales bacterium]|nr:MAG: PAS domain S-box protein [Nitrospirales bacterium]